ncbi:hypothetical protein B0H19DRAFT_1259902 [Mycena capillaripes]|nr:hypothetical protein B0H19DRAFT_1259902 [Mycena capillaripes]
MHQVLYCSPITINANGPSLNRCPMRTPCRSPAQPSAIVPRRTCGAATFVSLCSLCLTLADPNAAANPIAATFMAAPAAAFSVQPLCDANQPAPVAGFAPQHPYNVNQRFPAAFPAHAAVCAMRTRPNPAAAAFLPPRFAPQRPYNVSQRFPAAFPSRAAACTM